MFTLVFLLSLVTTSLAILDCSPGFENGVLVSQQDYNGCFTTDSGIYVESVNQTNPPGWIKCWEEIYVVYGTQTTGPWTSNGQITCDESGNGTCSQSIGNETEQCTSQTISIVTTVGLEILKFFSVDVDTTVAEELEHCTKETDTRGCTWKDANCNSMCTNLIMFATYGYKLIKCESNAQSTSGGGGGSTSAGSQSSVTTTQGQTITGQNTQLKTSTVPATAKSSIPLTVTTTLPLASNPLPTVQPTPSPGWSNGWSYGWSNGWLQRRVPQTSTQTTSSTICMQEWVVLSPLDKPININCGGTCSDDPCAALATPTPPYESPGSCFQNFVKQYPPQNIPSGGIPVSGATRSATNISELDGMLGMLLSLLVVFTISFGMM